MNNYLYNILAFAILCLLWLGFAFGIVFNPGLLDMVWLYFRALPAVLQILTGLILLPVVLALWIWESPWLVWMKLVLVIGLAIASLYMFLPRRQPVS